VLAYKILNTYMEGWHQKRSWRQNV